MNNKVSKLQKLLNSLLPGKLLPVGKHNHVPDGKFDPGQLKMGIQVEHEHTDDPNIAKAIAKDHLTECSTYYTHLEEMEKKCKEKKEG